MPANVEIRRLTPYQDVNGALAMLAEGVNGLIGDNIAGLYLTGSLSYGDFNPATSDIDFLSIMKRPFSSEAFDSIKVLHEGIGRAYPEWARRIEGSYITMAMLAEAPPPRRPRTPRPYINEGDFWRPDPVYGNEWTINLHVLYEKGVPLLGPDPKTFIAPVSIDAVKEASRMDLIEEWVPKLDDRAFFENSHYQAYMILTLCRILYRARHSDVASKRTAAAWAKKEYGLPWSDLIQKAEDWRYGMRMDAASEAREFTEFVASNVLNDRL